jgi:S1/P1 Nuclease
MQSLKPSGETMKSIAAALGLTLLVAVPQQASAWGDEGHMAVALIAEHFLKPAVKTQIIAMLAADTDNLTKHDIASEATWADKYRDVNERRLSGTARNTFPSCAARRQIPSDERSNWQISKIIQV